MNIFKAGKYSLDIQKKTYIMGILNITPDSFSDGGQWFNENNAFRKALQMKNDGADIIDIGGQSTRPGYTKISADEEFSRIYNTLNRVLNELDIPISVDTFYPDIAKECLNMGASIINDVSGFNKSMFDIVKKTNCGLIIMHSNQNKNIKQFFENKLSESETFKINKNRICFDPGIGFFKTFEKNIEIMRNFDKICIDGCTMMIAASRKRCIGFPCGNPPFNKRDPGTIAAHTIAISKGANIVRVHDVFSGVQSCKVIDAIIRRN